MVDYIIQAVRREPYVTDRCIMRIFGWMIPQGVTPNIVTGARLFFMPLMAYLLFRGSYGWGLALFLVLAFSDALDGALARTRKKITAWGIMYDPVADKLLIGSAVVILAVHRLGLGLATVVIALEVITILAGLYFKFFRKKIMPANGWGKTKMCLQVVAVTVLIIDAIVQIPILALAAFWMFIIAAGFAFVSLIFHGA